MKAELREMVNQFGQILTLHPQPTGSTYDPNTGKVTGGTSTPEAVKGYQSEYLNSEIDGTNIIRGDKEILVSATNEANAQTTTPMVGDYITASGSKYKVVAVQIIYIAAIPACYICQVRLA